jgi:hypothetical protein
MMRKSVLAMVLILAIPLVASAESLTGTWTGNDGGTAYIRQIGSEIFWYGEDDPSTPSYSHVAYGKRSGNRVILNWADVPKGGILGSGILVLKITNNDDTLGAIIKTGGFANSTWTRNP